MNGIVIEISNVLTERICEIFNLEPAKIMNMHIALEAGRPVTLITESVVTRDETDALATELLKYKLIAVEGGTEPERS